MDEKNIEILSKTGIPEELWSSCYITEDSEVFTPLIDADGHIASTGEQAYQQWLESKDTPPEPTLEQQTQQMITDLELQGIDQGQAITDLELQSLEQGQALTDLELKGGLANVI